MQEQFASLDCYYSICFNRPLAKGQKTSGHGYFTVATCSI